MRAVRYRTAGGPETLSVEDVPTPQAGAEDVVINVTGAGLNRADSLQRQGRYSLPPDASDIFGMEVSGIIDAVGSAVTAFRPGDRVMALLHSGGYADYVVVHSGHVLSVPPNIDLMDAAGIPEAAATVVSNVCIAGRFQPGETVLIHGATGGIGAFGIQLVKSLGGRVAVTGSSDSKLRRAAELGADLLINYQTEDFAERMLEVGGADIILDTVGGPYLSRNLDALALHGRIITIGLQGGPEGVLNLPVLMKKKASVMGTLLRDRTTEEKNLIMREVERLVLPLLASGAITTTTDRVFPLSHVAQAHEYFDSHTHVGKVLLDCRRDT